MIYYLFQRGGGGGCNNKSDLSLQVPAWWRSALSEVFSSFASVANEKMGCSL